MAHDGVAYEYFMPGGPFAILPLTGNRASLVWTEKDGPARAIKALDAEGFQEALEARFGDFLGWVRPVSQVHVYPLGLMLAERFTAERLALAGDAARTIHPIAGQGFNLGIRDAAALSDVIVDTLRAGLDPGSSAVLSRYERWRKTDSAALALSTDAFNLLFSNDNAALHHVRGLGLSLANAVPAARQFFHAHGGRRDRRSAPAAQGRAALTVMASPKSRTPPGGGPGGAPFKRAVRGEGLTGTLSISVADKR